MMNAEIKTQWLDALRSGQYTQGHRTLKTLMNNDPNIPTFSYCCLGVLCESLNIESSISDIKHEGLRVYTFSHKNKHKVESSSTGFLPPTLSRQLYITSEQETELAILNDQKGKSFFEIADYIEKNL